MKYLILIVIIFAFASCSKSDNPTELILEGTYEPQSFQTLESPVLITKNGSTMDTTIIKKFLTAKKENFSNISSIFVVDIKSQPAASIITTLKFHSSGSVTISYKPGIIWEEAEASITKKSNDEFMVEHIKTDTLMMGGNPPIVFEKYPYKMSGNLVSEVMGNLRAINYGFPLIIDKSNVYLPILNYIKIRNDHGISGYGNWGILNLANPDISSQLSDHDTVLVQMKKLKFIKK